MSEPKPAQKGSVLSNLDGAAEAPSPPATPSNQGRSTTPDDKMQLADLKDGSDMLSTTKDAEPEAKKRKRSQRACIRCRGQKLKCDGVFPCARCLKLKLVCKEPSEANSGGTPSSNKVHADDRDGKAHSASFSSSTSTRPQSQASLHLTASGLPSHASAHPPYASSMSDIMFVDRTRGANHTHASGHHREAMSHHHPTERFVYSLPDAVRRIDNLERTVARLAERVDGHPAAHFERNGTSAAVRPSSPRSGASPQKPERKRQRADSVDDSDAEVDELQDVASEASVPLHTLSHHDASNSHGLPGAAEERSGSRRSSNPAILTTRMSPAPIRPSSDGTRHAPASNPIDAGFITLEMGQVLVEVFLTYCHVFAPFLDLDSKTNAASLSQSEPFLLSVLVTIGALYQDSHGQSDNSLRSEIHAGLASFALSQLGQQLCNPEPTIGSVQAILLIAYWPQAFPGSPDEKLLTSHASNVLQSVARHAQTAALDGDRNAPLLSHRLPSLWASLRAFESLAAIDTGKGMDLTDHDLLLAKAPRPPRGSIPTPYLVRAASMLKEIQMWLSEMSFNSPLPLAEAPPSSGRSNLTHDWDRFKYLQSQLFDLEKRWLASETDCSRLERIVGLVDRWTLQIYLAAVALKVAEMGRPFKGSNGYDARYEEDSARFVVAYRHDVRQACQVLMDIFTDPEISGALLYAPGYLLRRFSQAAAASALLIDFHDADQTRSTQELIYLCSKRFDQLDRTNPSTFTAHLLWLVKSSFQKVGGRSSGHDRDAPIEVKPPSSMSSIDRRRYVGADLFSVFFGVGPTMDATTSMGNSAFLTGS
ncbi:putative fungal zinc cluster transcription factor [Pseudozyma hubeiensis]|nr:putative fungal zinc cluster transcription factor [Pseudozyma hubeiensis]